MRQAVIAVMGGTGFIGRHLLERLATDSTERVRVFVHELAPSWLAIAPRCKAPRAYASHTIP